MNRILFIDDEPFLLKALRRSFRSKRDQWEMHFVEDGDEALRLMDENAFDALVSDMRMPKMSGAQLVSEVVRRGHDTVRVLLTGQSEQQSIFPCLGLIHRFLTKPCEPKRLMQTLDQLLEARNKIPAGTLRSVLSNLECLPMQCGPREAFHDEIRTESPSLERLASLASSDIGIAVRLIQLARSGILAADVQDVHPNALIQAIGVETLQLLQQAECFLPKVKSSISDAELKSLNQRSFERANNGAACEHSDVSKNTAWMDGLLSEVGWLIIEKVFVANENATELSEPRIDHEDAVEYLMKLWAPDFACRCNS